MKINCSHLYYGREQDLSVGRFLSYEVGAMQIVTYWYPGMLKLGNFTAGVNKLLPCGLKTSRLEKLMKSPI